MFMFDFMFDKVLIAQFVRCFDAVHIIHLLQTNCKAVRWI